MPRLNPAGDWCAGIGGGVVSVNGTVIASNAGGACWLDHVHVLYQQGAHLETFDIRTGEIVTIDPEGATELAAGGGVYAAKHGAVRVSNRTERYPAYGVGDVGSDGSVLLKTPDGLFQGQYVKDLQALGGGLWSGLDGSYRPIQSVGLPSPQVVAGRIYGLRRYGAYCCYQAEQGARMIVQDIDRRVGLVLAIAPRAFRPDLTVLSDGRVRVVYAETEGEDPGSVRVFTVSPVGFAPLPLEPEKPEDDPPMPTVPDESAFARAFLTPRLKRLASIEETRANTFAAVNAFVTALRARGDHNWGVLEKTGGDRVRDRAADIALYALGDGTAKVVDIVNDAEGSNGSPSPSWSVKDIRPISQWRQPYTDEPPHDPPDDPHDDSDVAKLRSEFDMFAKSVAAMLGSIDGRLDDHQKQINIEREERVVLAGVVEKLKAGTGGKVKGRTSRVFGHSHDVELTVTQE